MTKAELRRVYRLWVKEEIEFIEVIEAVGKFLGEEGKDRPLRLDYECDPKHDYDCECLNCWNVKEIV